MTERRRVEALERADIRRTEFLAMLAHELRNPLAPIRNALGLIGPTRPDDATLEWSRAVIERQVGHLTRLVDDLLDVSRITANKIALQREPVEIAQVVSGAVEASQPLIQEKRQILEVHIPEEPVRVTGDLTRLSQVVLNLLNNAAKYTPEGGRIRLTVERQESEAVLRVRDTGMGIAANLLPEIFELFTQGERSLDRPEGGLGIGLTLVKRLVELHGGTVQASSEGPGLGTEMIVRLPLLAGDLPADSPKTYGSGRASAARRVLVVDDNRDATETMALLLELWGHEVYSALDGPSALAMAAEHRPEIVLLDIGLPGMTGYEVAQRLRDVPGLERALLVAVTGYGQREDRRRTREAGFEHHLVKPVEPEKLRELIDSAFSPE